MVLVDPATGTGYVIQSVTMQNQVNLLTGLTLNAPLYGIIPEYRYYTARVGHGFFQEPYKISCNANDQQQLLWLHSITMYSLLRYRQALLEHDGYAESIISSSKIYANSDYSDAGQVIWARDINITGQVENRWYMAPHRIIENVAYGNANGSEGGIKISSNITNTFEDPNTVDWVTIADSLDSE